MLTHRFHLIQFELYYYYFHTETQYINIVAPIKCVNCKILQTFLIVFHVLSAIWISLNITKELVVNRDSFLCSISSPLPQWNTNVQLSTRLYHKIFNLTIISSSHIDSIPYLPVYEAYISLLICYAQVCCHTFFNVTYFWLLNYYFYNNALLLDMYGCWLFIHIRKIFLWRHHFTNRWMPPLSIEKCVLCLSWY